MPLPVIDETAGKVSHDGKFKGEAREPDPMW